MIRYFPFDLRFLNAGVGSIRISIDWGLPDCRGKSASIVVLFPSSLGANEKNDRYFAHKSSTCAQWSDENVLLP